MIVVDRDDKTSSSEKLKRMPKVEFLVSKHANAWEPCKKQAKN